MKWKDYLDSNINSGIPREGCFTKHMILVEWFEMQIHWEWKQLATAESAYLHLSWSSLNIPYPPPKKTPSAF